MKWKSVLASSFMALMVSSCNTLNINTGSIVDASVEGQTINVQINFDEETQSYSTVVAYVFGSATFRVQPGAPATQVMGFEAQVLDEDNNTYTVSTQGGMGAGASLPGGWVCPADKSAINEETRDLFYCKREDWAPKAYTGTVAFPANLIPDISKTLSQDCLKSLANQLPTVGVCPNLKIRVKFTLKNLSNNTTFTVTAFPDPTNIGVKGGAGE